jgi:cytochrome P450
MARWMKNPMVVLDECRARYGSVFTIHLAMAGKIVVTDDLGAVKDIFALGPDAGHAGKANYVLKPFLGKHSLLLLDGAEHIRQRKMMMPAFHGERMHAYGRAMIDLTHESIDTWPVGAPFPIHGKLQAITLQVILRTVFGIVEGPQFEELARLVSRGLEIITWPPLLFEFMQKDLGPLSPWGRFRRIGARVREVLVAEMRRGRAHGTAGRTDVLAMMLDAKDEAGHPLSEDELHDELITLLVAGHETTATALAWALRWLCADEPLLREVTEVARELGGDVAKIAKNDLLDGVVREALRVQPVIPMVGRILQEPMTLCGHEIPKGAAVAPAIYLVHHNESLYPDAAKFDPHRYAKWKPAAWEWIPFGGGLRRCIGAAFAIFEMKMVLATVLPRVAVRLAKDDIKAVRRSITLTPSGGLPVVVRVKRPRDRDARAA